MRLLEASNMVKGGLLTAIALPVVLASDLGVVAGLSHRHSHFHQKKHTAPHSPAVESKLEKRGGACRFPKKGRMVAVAESRMNGGWALPPDQPCQPGMYCPYACPPGYLMAQWDPDATEYTYPQSMNGGLRCGLDGEVAVPFPDKPFCYEGHGTFLAKNLLSEPVAICQTVLPGREDMLIPTVVQPNQYSVLAVPGSEYWCKTAAHYYINPPGVSVEEGCIWGSTAHPRGNWTPYVAGANIDDNGNTFTKIGWNPIYLEPATPFRDVRPDWGVKIICEEGKQCNGLPCIIDPAVDAVNSVNSQSGASTNGAGGANFCVVTAPAGSKAILVTFPAGKSDDDSAAIPIGTLDISSSSEEPEPEPSTSTTSTSSSAYSEPPVYTSSTSTSSSTTSSSTSTSTTSSTSSKSTSTSVLLVEYHNTTTSAYTPTLTPVNQGASNVTGDGSLYTDAPSSTVNLPQPSTSDLPQGAGAMTLPNIATFVTLGMMSVLYAVVGF